MKKDKAKRPNDHNPKREDHPRDKRNRTETSARFSNAPRHEVTAMNDQSPPYEEWSKHDLYERAVE